MINPFVLGQSKQANRVVNKLTGITRKKIVPYRGISAKTPYLPFFPKMRFWCSVMQNDPKNIVWKFCTKILNILGIIVQFQNHVSFFSKFQENKNSLFQNTLFWQRLKATESLFYLCQKQVIHVTLFLQKGNMELILKTVCKKNVYQVELFLHQVMLGTFWKNFMPKPLISNYSGLAHYYFSHKES